MLADASVLDLGLEIIGLVCSNVGAGDDRHYWLVECSQGKLQRAYNSLKGVQKITRELYRMLAVTGLLLVTESSKKPPLRTANLDIAAGRVPRVKRQTKPIKVAGRNASNRQRNFLMPKLKSLEFPSRNLKVFFHNQAELQSDHSAGSADRQKLTSTKRKIQSCCC